MQFIIEPNVVNYFMLCATMLTMAFGYYWYSLCYKKLECKSSERRFERCIDIFRENSPMVNNCISTLLNLVTRIERDVTDYYRYTALCGFANKIFQPIMKFCGKCMDKPDRGVGSRINCGSTNFSGNNYCADGSSFYGCDGRGQWNEIFDEHYNLRPGVCPEKSPLFCDRDQCTPNTDIFFPNVRSSRYAPETASTPKPSYFTNLCNAIVDYMPLITSMVSMYMPKTMPAVSVAPSTPTTTMPPKLDINALMKGFNFDEILKNINTENCKENSDSQTCQPTAEPEKCVAETEKLPECNENKNVVDVNTDKESDKTGKEASAPACD